MHKIFMVYLLLFSQVIWAAENATEQPTEDPVSYTHLRAHET